MEQAAIVSKGKKAWIGILKDYEFIPESEFNETSIPEGYISLYEYLILTDPKITKKDADDIRKTIGYTKVFVFIEDNDDFWAYTNHKCNTCKKKCKQSSKVEVYFCPLYEK